MNEFSLLESVFSFVSRGGIVLIPIFFIGLYAWFLLVFKFSNYLVYSRKYKKLLNDVFRKNEKYGETSLKYAFEECISAVSSEMNQSMRSVVVATSVAPLLGLLGTVSGMVHTFEIIEMFGFGNPVLLADGISEALLTTQAGLLVAFPLLLAYNYLSSCMERLEAKMNQESLHLNTLRKECP